MIKKIAWIAIEIVEKRGVDLSNENRVVAGYHI